MHRINVKKNFKLYHLWISIVLPFSLLILYRNFTNVVIYTRTKTFPILFGSDRDYPYELGTWFV